MLAVCHVSFRPGGELIPGEDQTEGLKRLLAEVWHMPSLWLTHLVYCSLSLVK